MKERWGTLASDPNNKSHLIICHTNHGFSLGVLYQVKDHSIPASPRLALNHLC